jgi:hypothetical protein
MSGQSMKESSLLKNRMLLWDSVIFLETGGRGSSFIIKFGKIKKSVNGSVKQSSSL